MPSSLQQEQQKPDMHHLKSILDDNSLTFAEKAISIKNVEMNNRKFMAGEIVIVSVDLLWRRIVQALWLYDRSVKWE